MEETVIKIEGMSCGGCVKNITGVLTALPGVSKVNVSLEAAEAAVAFEPVQVTRAALCSAIEDAGFDAQ